MCDTKRESVLVNFCCYIQSNRDSSNTDGSFTISNSNSFLSPYEILPIAQENIIKEIFLFYREVVCRGYSNEYTQNTIFV